jgi:hypothetical protein
MVLVESGRSRVQIETYAAGWSMSKAISKGFWIVLAAVLIVGGYYYSPNYHPWDDTPKATTVTINMEDDSPRCVNASGDGVDIQPRQHKVFVERKFAGLIVPQDEKTILYDYDELSKESKEYRDFVLRVACARTANQDEQAAQCMAVKRLRDEKRITREKLPLIAQRLAANSDKTQALTACFDAPG